MEVEPGIRHKMLIINYLKEFLFKNKKINTSIYLFRIILNTN